MDIILINTFDKRILMKHCIVINKGKMVAAVWAKNLLIYFYTYVASYSQVPGWIETTNKEM